MRDEIKPWIDIYGCVKTQDVQTSGNPLRYSSEWLIIDPSYETWSVMQCKQLGGIFIKGPKNYQDQVTQDDLIPLTRAMVERSLLSEAQAIYDELKRSWGCYNNNIKLPWRQRFIGRNLSLVAHLSWCAGRKPGVVLLATQLASILTTGLKNPRDQDGWALSAHMLEVAGPRPKAIAWAGRIMLKRMIKTYPSLGHCLHDYFGFWHPIATNAATLYPWCYSLLFQLLGQTSQTPGGKTS